MKKTWVRKTLSVGVLAAGALLFAPAAAAQAEADQVTYSASARTESGFAGGDGGDGVGSVDQVSAGNLGALNGTQIAVPITVPINACGNSLAVVGLTSANGFCANALGGGGRRAWDLESKQQARTESGLDGDGVGAVDQVSAGNFGALNGTQIAAPITVPINVCGNSLAVLGLAHSNGVCANYLGGGDGKRRHIHFVKPVRTFKPIWPSDVIGDGGSLGDDCGVVKGIVKGDGYGCDDDHGDVRGDHGYNDNKGVKNDGYGKPGADVADDGYGGQAPDQYGDKGHNHGGRKAKSEKSPVSELTDGLGGIGSAGLGGLDLLGTLR